MDKKINVFILAAGLGERLRPITNYIPKPLLPILGKPVLQVVFERVLALPVNKIGINLHYKKENVESWIRQYFLNETNYPSPLPSPTRGEGTLLYIPLPDTSGEGARGRVKDVFLDEDTLLFPEEQILGTGGALKNAEPFLSGKPFLVHNSDILSDINLERLLEYHLSSENLVTLAVHDYPKFNNLIVDEKGFLKDIGRKSKGGRRPAFTGIAVYSPEFLKFLPVGASSVVDAWLKALSVGYKIGTFDVSGCYWNDIGTPSAYASAVIDALKKEGETVYIHPSVKSSKDVDLQGYVAVEKDCVFEEDISLRNCIVLSSPPPFDPSVSPLSKGGIKGIRGFYENCIIGPDFKIALDESEFLNIQDGRYLIGTGGSERRYYRTGKGKESVVIMQCADEDPDFERHMEYTRFFVKHRVPVPELKDVEVDKMRAVFEDLGDLSLYNWLKLRRDERRVEGIYQRVIDILVVIHAITADSVSQCPLLKERVFDYDHFRWETAYFMERFVEGVRHMEVKNSDALNNEFHMLAVKADSFPKTIIHRDFQSQNIMITKGEIPRLIDYQGARPGPPAYDAASILWDPYYRLEEDIRERLLDYYINKMIINCSVPSPLAGEGRGEGNILFLEKDFRNSLLPCCLQRHMQALGAYGFLSEVKGKKYFLKHIPEGLRLLKEDITLSKDEYPVLYELVMGL